MEKCDSCDRLVAAEKAIDELRAALDGKLDKAVYNDDAPLRIKAWGAVKRTGAIYASKNIMAVTRTTSASYMVHSPAITPTSVVLSSGPYWEAKGVSSGCCDIVSTTDAVPNDEGFLILVLGV